MWLHTDRVSENDIRIVNWAGIDALNRYPKSVEGRGLNLTVFLIED